jgi:hypothetical protein
MRGIEPTRRLEYFGSAAWREDNSPRGWHETDHVTIDTTQGWIFVPPVNPDSTELVHFTFFDWDPVSRRCVRRPSIIPTAPTPEPAAPPVTTPARTEDGPATVQLTMFDDVPPPKRSRRKPRGTTAGLGS